VPVALEWEHGSLTFAWMTQPLPEFGVEIGDREALAAAAGVAAADLADAPVQEVSCGVPFLFVPLRSRGAVDRVALDRRALQRALASVGRDDLPAFFFTTDRDGARGDETVYSRMLAPAFGIAEDPATGSASGPLGCYLLRHGLVTADEARTLVSLQGAAMGRPSRIHISIESDGGAIARVRVGGSAVLVAEGRVMV
jgi:trans-2,3-dihydro-3-hydroxyanthranilate isomerase